MNIEQLIEQYKTDVKSLTNILNEKIVIVTNGNEQIKQLEHECFKLQGAIQIKNEDIKKLEQTLQDGEKNVK